MQIRKATVEDLPRLMDIYREARQIMLENGNMHQWAEGYPSQQQILSDITKGWCHAVLQGGKVVAAFAFVPGDDPTYASIEGGQWLDEKSPYMTIHRMGSTRSSSGVAAFCYSWCRSQFPNLRVDTHADNAIMRHCIEKAGFRYCGVIHLLNGDPRLAFQLLVG